MDITVFLGIVIMHCFALLTPGPDVFIIMRFAIGGGMRSVVPASIGIGLGISFWILASILFLDFVSSKIFLSFVMIFGFFYMLNIAYLLLKHGSSLASNGNENGNCGVLKSFFVGLFTNLSNPKAIFYFSSIFSVFVNKFSTYSYLLLFAIVLESIILFIIIGRLFAANKAIKIFNTYQRKIDIICAVIFTIFAFYIAYELYCLYF